MSPPSNAREPLPRFVAPMLLQSGPPAQPVSGEWAIEVKFDGIRAQLRVDRSRGWSLRSRPGRDCTVQFPELACLADALAAPRLILDGELVHLGADGRPNFTRLRRRLTPRDEAAAMRASGECPATLIVFDVLHLDGVAVRALAYEQRRALLLGLVGEGPYWRLAPS